MIAQIQAKPRYTKPRFTSVSQARAEVSRRIEAFIKVAMGEEIGETWGVPHVALKVTGGAGKTHTAIQKIADAIAYKNAQKIVFFVSNHKKAAEVDQLAKSLGIRSGVFAGYEARDTQNSNFMNCRDEVNLEIVKELHLSVKSTLCPTCPLAAECGRKRIEAALQEEEWQLIIVANTHLALAPDPLLAGADFLVIDEDILKVGVNTDARPSRLTINDLHPNQNVLKFEREADQTYLSDGFVDEDAVEFRDQLQKIHDFFVEAETDYIRTSDLRAHEIRASDLEYLAKKIYDTADTPTFDRSMTREQIEAQREKSRLKAIASIKSKLFKGLAESLDSGIQTIGRISKVDLRSNIGTAPGIEISILKPIHKNWLQKPILLLDATAEVDLLRLYIPTLVAGPAILVSGNEHSKVIQVLGSPTSKSKTKIDDADPESRSNRTNKNNARKLALSIWANAKSYQKVGVIGNKSLIEKLEKMGMPENAILGHFNAQRGSNLWEDVDCLMIFGRTASAPQILERQAQFFCPDPIQKIVAGVNSESSYYPREAVRIDPRLGDPVEVQAEFHPDKTAERLRRNITESELEQAFYRARTVNRTALNPVTVMIFNDVPLPFGVDDVVHFKAVKAGRREELFVAQGVVFDNKHHAAAAYRQAFEKGWFEAALAGVLTKAQVKFDSLVRDFDRILKASDKRLISDSLLESCPDLIRVWYRIEGIEDRLFSCLTNRRNLPKIAEIIGDLIGVRVVIEEGRQKISTETEPQTAPDFAVLARKFRLTNLQVLIEQNRKQYVPKYLLEEDDPVPV